MKKSFFTGLFIFVYLCFLLVVVSLYLLPEHLMRRNVRQNRKEDLKQDQLQVLLLEVPQLLP